MLLKWIICEVPQDKQDAFSKAQQHWRALERVAGFRGQVGGWDSMEPNRACILGLWANAEAYVQFMEHVHDPIFEQSHQKETYVDSRITRANVLLDITGTHPKMDSAVSDAKLLRVADCLLKPRRNEHFIEMQETVWNPAMTATGDMLAGAFSAVENQADRYLVTTLWRNETAHKAYVANTLPNLQVRAGIKEDLLQISGHVVKLDNNWSVAAQ